jgi:hypothetical protein
MGLLYGRAGRLTALFGGFRPGQYDDGCRGVGGTVHVPCTSVGEENLLGIAIGGDPHFKDESILVHEFAHAVMNIGISGDFCFPDHGVLHNLRCKFIPRFLLFSDSARDRIRMAYELAHDSGSFDNESYMMSNAEEFWCVVLALSVCVDHVDHDCPLHPDQGGGCAGMVSRIGEFL